MKPLHHAYVSVSLLLVCCLFVYPSVAMGEDGGRSTSAEVNQHALRQAMISRASAGDTTLLWYHYRILSVFYHSTQIDGLFGEVFLIHGTGDSTRVRFKDSFGDSGVDSTISYVNSSARTNLFSCDDVTNISLFRVIYLFFQSENQHDLGITDTCAWAVELVNKDGEKIATLDSIAVYPRVYGFEMPSMGPDSVGFCNLNVACQGFQFEAEDSAYIRIVLIKRGSGNPGYSLRDRLHAHERLSSTFGLTLGKRSEAGSDAHAGKALDAVMNVSPNPAQNRFLISLTLNRAAAFSLELFNSQGRSMGVIHRGHRAEGTYFFSYANPHGLAPGVYYLQFRDITTGQSTSHQVIIAR